MKTAVDFVIDASHLPGRLKSHWQSKSRCRAATLAIASIAVLGPASVTAGFQDEQPGETDIAIVAIEPADIDADADQFLRAMGEALATAKEFTFRADVAYDVMYSHGQMVQFGGTSEASVRRPGQVRAIYNGDERRTQTYLNKGDLTILNVNADVYAKAEVPEGIDAAVDFIFERLGFTVPIADLLYADPYAVLTENVQTGFVVGEHPIDGTPCTHLAFSQDLIDWEIWIASEDEPLPRKLVIRYKDEQGSPQYTALLSEWDLSPQYSLDHFEFHAPDGADQIEFLPRPKAEDQP